MKAKDVATELLRTPDAEVLIKVRDDWVEVAKVGATGQHRNGVTLFTVYDLGISGVIVVPPDIEEKR